MLENEIKHGSHAQGAYSSFKKKDASSQLQDNVLNAIIQAKIRVEVGALGLSEGKSRKYFKGRSSFTFLTHLM